jgi:acyl carrier protein
MMNRRDVVSLIIATVEELKDEREVTSHDPVTESTVLFGRGGIFDSLGLVSLIVDVEQQIEDRGISIILGDERAVSQKRSPFRTVQSLADYAYQLIEEQQRART